MPLSRDQGAFGSIRWRGFSVASPAGSGCSFWPLRTQAAASGLAGSGCRLWPLGARIKRVARSNEKRYEEAGRVHRGYSAAEA
jgi:hypothetical protein